MVHFGAQIFGLLATAAIVSAVPAPPHFTLHRPNSVFATTATALAKTSAVTVTRTSVATPSSTVQITIPDADIDSAPLQDTQSGDQNLISIPGNDNSTLVQARPDLQEYVNAAAHLTGNKTLNVKRGSGTLNSPIAKRTENPLDCNSAITPALTQPTWNKIVGRICNNWYPDPTTFQYDPSAPWPASLKSSSLGPINVGGGEVVTLQFSYGVNDWGTQLDFGWQPYYEPQSQALCIADLTNLVNEMNNVCLYTTGYDTSQDITGTGQPKWYMFSAS